MAEAFAEDQIDRLPFALRQRADALEDLAGIDLLLRDRRFGVVGVLTVARLIRKKGIPTILGAVRRLCDQGVSLASVWQEGRGTGATLLLVTHEAPESALRAARMAVEALDVVIRVAARIRVHDPE